MDPSSTVARARAEADELALAPIPPISANSQNFSNIFAHDSSRLHVGNNYNSYYVTWIGSASHELTQRLLSDTSSEGHLAQTSQKRKRSVEDVGDAVRAPRPKESLDVVLKSLEEFSKSIYHMKEGKESTRIADQLGVILDSLSTVGQNDMVPGDLDSQVQRLHHQLKGARRIKINDASLRPLMTEVHRVHSKVFSVTSGQWTISLTTKSLTSRPVYGSIRTETWSALRVQHVSRSSSISAFFGERDEIDTTTTVCPVIMAYNRVYNGSEVFELVKLDALDGLKTLLAAGKGSLRDCDEDDRCLLHYACWYGSVDICKYLVESGADIERCGRYFNDIEISGSPLVTCSWMHQDQDNEPELQKLKADCSAVLLRAGADPTSRGIGLDDYQLFESPLFESLGVTTRPGTTVMLAHILRESLPFFDIRTIREQGLSVWQSSCSKSRRLPSFEILRLLVKAKIDIKEIDDDGWNCLFLCAINAKHPSRPEEFQALCYLLTVSPDIHAKDHYDETIFEILESDSFASSTGSYQYDLWYCALYRSRLASRLKIPPPFRHTVFAENYELRHYCALLYLDSWDYMPPFKRNHPMPNHFPLSEEERKQVPAFHQWHLPDLLMMEERALYGSCRDDRGCISVDEYSDLSSEGCEEESTGTGEEDDGYISEDESSYQSSEAPEEESAGISGP